MQELLPREKLIQKGSDAMTDLDLLGAMISTGTKGKSFTEIARQVLRIIREQASVGDSVDLKALMKIDGIGVAKAVKILAGIEIGRRIYSIDCSKKIISTSKAAYEIVKNLSNKKQEHLVCIYLNARYELIAKKTVGIGTLNKLEVVPRDVLIPALEYNAAAIIIAHNHPSGDSTPSQEDISMTKRIREACEIVRIILLDHILVTKDGFVSIEDG